MDGFGIKPSVKNKRIYISRNKAKIRKIINEKEFFSMLKKYNFEKVYAEDLSYKEQVETFNSANITVSVFGAGFSNLIFSDNCKVLEIYPPNKIRTHYFMLSKALGLEYYYVIGYDLKENVNFKVDVKKAEIIIQKMIKTQI